jgi:hypothetical protein
VQGHSPWHGSKWPNHDNGDMAKVVPGLRSILNWRWAVISHPISGKRATPPSAIMPGGVVLCPDSAIPRLRSKQHIRTAIVCSKLLTFVVVKP